MKPDGGEETVRSRVWEEKSVEEIYGCSERKDDFPIRSFTATIDRAEALLWFHENY